MRYVALMEIEVDAPNLSVAAQCVLAAMETGSSDGYRPDQNGPGAGIVDYDVVRVRAIGSRMPSAETGE